MQKTSREKIALIVFALLVVFAGFCLGAYLIAGHSWNVAATTIDDAAGSMEGYTVIAYTGTVDEAASKKKATGLEVKDDASGDEPASEAVTDTTAADKARQSALSAKLGSDQVSFDEVVQDYLDKDAQVIILDTQNIGGYEEETIVKRNGKRYGVMSVDEPLSRILIDEKVEYLRKQNVDTLICLTASLSYLEGIEGIDIIVSTANEDLSPLGETKDGAFCVSAPELGSVGLILISPSNVVSAKTVSQ